MATRNADGTVTLNLQMAAPIPINNSPGDAQDIPSLAMMPHTAQDSNTQGI